jgi:hypothetical protein
MKIKVFETLLNSPVTDNVEDIPVGAAQVAPADGFVPMPLSVHGAAAEAVETLANAMIATSDRISPERVSLFEIII